MKKQNDSPSGQPQGVAIRRSKPVDLEHAHEDQHHEHYDHHLADHHGEHQPEHPHGAGHAGEHPADPAEHPAVHVDDPAVLLDGAHDGHVAHDGHDTHHAHDAHDEHHAHLVHEAHVEPRHGHTHDEHHEHTTDDAPIHDDPAHRFRAGRDTMLNAILETTDRFLVASLRKLDDRHHDALLYHLWETKDLDFSDEEIHYRNPGFEPTYNVNVDNRIVIKASELLRKHFMHQIRAERSRGKLDPALLDEVELLARKGRIQFFIRRHSTGGGRGASGGSW